MPDKVSKKRAPQKRRSKSAKKPAMPARGWHYISDGDYPPKGRGVLAHVADLSHWVKAMTAGETRAQIEMFEQTASYKGMIGGVDCWDGLPFHCAVTAWCELSTPDTDKEKAVIVSVQQMAGERADVLKWLIASAFRYMPDKNAPLIDGLVKKFQRNAQQDKRKAHCITDAGACAYVNERGTVFSVECRFGYGIIVQQDKRGGRARYARDFAKPKRIYSDVHAAALALVAEAERQKWRRVG